MSEPRSRSVDASTIVDPASPYGALVTLPAANVAELLRTPSRPERARFISLDRDATINGTEFRRAVAVSLGLPDHYGWNWDSLADGFYECGQNGVDAIILFAQGSDFLAGWDFMDSGALLRLLRELLEGLRRGDGELSPLVRLIAFDDVELP